MPSIKFDITGDNKQLVSSLQQAQQVISKTIAALDTEGSKIDKTFTQASQSVSGFESTLKKVGAGIGAYFAAEKIKDFAGEVINVRKEFQSLEVSFTTLLGSAEKGKKLFKDITDFATSTPMLEKDLAKGAQTMLGFGVDESKVMEYLRELGDVSMGDSEKFQSLTLAFAQIQASGKLMGQDLNQLINAGFNPLAEISRTTGRSMADLKEDMSKGAISAEMVADAFKSATSEGGKFHGILEAQSKTLAGSISNLEGALQKLFNEIGKEGEGVVINVVNDLTAGANKLTDSLEQVSSTLTYCIGAFGGYKAACMLVSASNSIAAASALGYSLKTQMLRKEVTLMNAAQALLNKTMLLNPYVLAGVAAGALAVAVYKIATADDAATLAQKNYNEEVEEAKRKQEEHNQKVEEYISIATDEGKSTNDRKDALDLLVKAYPNIINKYIDEEGHLTNILQLKREIAMIDGKKNLGDVKSQSQVYNRYADVIQKYINNGGSKKGMSSDERYLLGAAVQQYEKDNPWSKNIMSTYNDYLSYFQSKGNAATKQYGKTLGSNSMAQQADKVSEMTKSQLESSKKYWNSILKKFNENGKDEGYVKGIGIITANQVNTLLAQIDTRLTPAQKGMSEKERKAAERAAEKARKEQEQQNKQSAKDTQALADAETKATEEAGKQKAQAQLDARQYEINAMAEGRARTLKQIQLDYDKEKQAIKDGIADTIKANEEADRQLWETQNPDASKKNQNWDNTGKVGKTFGLTAEQKAMYKAREDANQANYQRQLEEQAKQDTQYDNEYLKKYGNVQEQRLAIVREYNQKITDLQVKGATEAEIATAKADKDAALSNFDSDQIKKTLNWDVIYGNLDELDKKTLEHVRGQLQQFIDTTKNLTPSDIKDLQTALQSLDEHIDMTNCISAFQKAKEEAQKAAQDVIVARQKMDAAAGENNAANLELGIANNNVDKTKKDLDDASKAGDTMKVASATIAYNSALNQQQKAKAKVTATTKKLGSAEQDLQKKESKSISAQTKQKKSAATLRDGLAKLGDQMSSLGTTVGGTAGQLLQFGSTAITAFNTTSKGIETIKKDVISLESSVAILAIIQAAFTAISEAANLLGLGGDSAATKQAKELADQYSAMKDIWDELIEKKQEYISISYGAEAKEAYEDARSYISNEEEYARKAAEAQLKAGASAGSHSYGYRMWQGSYKDENGRNWQDVANEISKAIGVNITGMQSFTQLSGEQLEYIKENYVGLWAAMDDTFQGYLEDIINAEESTKDLQDSLNEAITGVTFDDFYDNFVDLMGDMDSDASDFADNFEEYLKNAILQSLLANKYKSKIQNLYDSWTKAADSNGDGINDMTAEETKQLKAAESALAQEMLADRDNLMQTFGLSSSSSQTATANGIENITADQADQLVGRITAMQIAVEQSKDTTVQLSAQVTAGVNQLLQISNGTTAASKYLSDILLQMQTTNGYLYDIADRNKKMYNEWTEKLDTINNSIKNS